MMSSSSLPSRYLSTRHAAGLYASWLMSFLTLPAYAYSMIQQQMSMSTALAGTNVQGFTCSRKWLLHFDGMRSHDRLGFGCVRSCIRSRHPPLREEHTLLSGSLYDVCIELRTRGAHNMSAVMPSSTSSSCPCGFCAYHLSM